MKLLNNCEFKNRFLNQIGEDDKSLLGSFLTAWELWNELYPMEGEFFKLALIPANNILLRDAIPEAVNDVFSCTSHLSLDSFAEDFNVKSGLKLLFANKALGGQETLVIACPLNSFLSTIRLMLQSLILRQSEATLLKQIGDGNIVQNLIDRIEGIKQTADELHIQFEKMKRE